MSKRILASLLTLAALGVAACGGGDNNNANRSNANANANRANANTNANTAANTNANANANRPLNGNMSRADYDRDRDYYEGEARRSGRKIGTGANDMWLWTKVRAQLMTADDLRDSTINVDVENGNVTLTGTVANGNQKVRAADIARKTEGVGKITNNLTVAAGGGSNTNAAANRRAG